MKWRTFCDRVGGPPGPDLQFCHYPGTVEVQEDPNEERVSMGKKLARILILTEGIRGHLFQSRGIAYWLSGKTGAEIREFQVPRLKGWDRFWQLKVIARFIPAMDHPSLKKWISRAGGEGLLLRIREDLFSSGVKPEQCLLISAGSNPARYNLALGKLLGIRTCVLMTPSLLGTEPFDFAILPRHDAPSESPNILETLGAPNFIDREKLKTEAEKLSTYYAPGKSTEKWAILIGGDDANYLLGPEWAQSVISRIMDLALKADAELYITTSRRTSPETEQILKELVHGRTFVKMLLLASESDLNPVPGMLGLCSRVFCTEDSVSMLSESATAGHEVLLLRTDRKRGWRYVLQGFTRFLVETGLLSRSVLWGVPRFDTMIDDFIEKGLIVELPEDLGHWDVPMIMGTERGLEFNEARRAAQWILEEWQS